jgi:chemotaxis methyl-accepting protein methylase
MSTEQFPAEKRANVSFSTMNILDPVPESLHNKFDVLHLRLLVLGLPKDTWTQAARNLQQMLKPGGWLQWEEADFW